MGEKFRIDFIGVGFGRSGCAWLTKCLFEHPEISIPKFNLHTEINYFPEEYEVMGLSNYIKKFKNCDFSKIVGELSTLVIFKSRSAKILKVLFPEAKIIIYKRDERKRRDSARSVAENLDLVKDNSISGNPINLIDQESYIFPFLKAFGKKNVFIFDMEKRDKQKELNRLFRFLGVSNFRPSCIDERPNSAYLDKSKKSIKKARYPLARKTINLLKYFFKKNPRLYYTLKRNFKLDYYYQLLNHNMSS